MTNKAEENATTLVVQTSGGLEYRLHEESWNKAGDYYLEFTIEQLDRIVSEIKSRGNPLKDVLELGIARGTLSIGVALLTDENTRIVGIDIDPKAKELVAKNGALNGVGGKIDTRIGNLFEPIKSDEKFDFLIGELPIIPVAESRRELYIQEGFGDDIRNVCGGEDGRLFIDTLISQGSRLLRAGGFILLAQPSFVGLDTTLGLMGQCGLQGRLFASREKLLNSTTFTRENRDHIVSLRSDAFSINKEGEEVFDLQLVIGEKIDE